MPRTPCCRKMISSLVGEAKERGSAVVVGGRREALAAGARGDRGVGDGAFAGQFAVRRLVVRGLGIPRLERGAEEGKRIAQHREHDQQQRADGDDFEQLEQSRHEDGCSRAGLTICGRGWRGRGQVGEASAFSKVAGLR